jgi:hypothetical protein
MRIIVEADECRPLFAPRPAMQLREIGRILRQSAAPLAEPLSALVARMGSPATPFAALSGEQKEMLLLTAHVGPFILTPGLTAIIAPNDKHARQIFRWLAAAGIRTPHDLSLLSFDDRQDVTWPHAISSVNFGFDSLGYAAFHALLGDIPVKVDAWRSVATVARVNHLGTIGPAPRFGRAR